MQAGKRAVDLPGEILDAGPLGGVVAGDQQADAECLGFDAAVKPRLAREKGIGTRSAASLRKSSPAPQATARRSTRRSEFAGRPHDGDPERPADRRGEFGQRSRLGQPADAADARRRSAGSASGSCNGYTSIAGSSYE